MKRELKISRGLGLIILVGFLAACLIPAGDALPQTTIKPIKLKAASVYPPPEVSMLSEGMKIWMDEVTKRTEGAITFETFWGASIGAPAEHIDLIKKGTVDVALIYQWYTPGRAPLGNFDYVFPFGSNDYDLVAKAMIKIRSEFPQFAADEARENIIMMTKYPIGAYNFMSKKPLRTIDDFKGEKVSLVGRYFGRWLPPGASAVVRPGQERYDLLRTGIVNIDLLPFDLFYAFKIHEVTKYFIKADILTGCAGDVFMNLDTFKKFPPEVQKILLESGEDIMLRIGKEVVPRWWGRIKKEYEAKGITFIDFPEEEKRKWAATIKDIPAEWAAEVEAKGFPGFKIVQRWQEITTELGFKWPRKWGIK